MENSDQTTEENVLPFTYVICENKFEMTGAKVSIFDLQLQDLIFEKMFIMFQKLQPANKNVAQTKAELQVAKDDLLMQTNFKEVLGESRPTVAMKEAWINKQTSIKDLTDKLNSYEEDVQTYKDKVNILNDLIKAQRTLLAIEGALQ